MRLFSFIFCLFVLSCKSTPDLDIVLETDSRTIPEPLEAFILSCPDDMVEVIGNYCESVSQNCLVLDKTVHNANGYVKCDKFESKTTCLSKTTTKLHFCIDKYEYPNKQNEKPEIMISWNQLKNKCESIGKRLCLDKEWTQACEGNERFPYPYGFERNPNLCNIDKLQKPGFDPSKDKMTSDMVSYLDQRVESGTMNCVSPYGVHDMTGNVDESVVNSSMKPYKSAEMGGHWVKGARNRCRPKTIVHNEEFQYYEIGGRCCKDVR